MGIVADKLKIFEAKVAEVANLRVQLHSRKWAGRAPQLFPRLLEMILVQVEIAESMDEFSGGQPANLRDHHRQERIAGDIEGHSEKEVGASLIELTTQLSILNMELEKSMTGRQCHSVNFRRIPGSHNQPPAVGLGLDLLDHPIDLVDPLILRATPVAPLRAIDPAELAILIRPFVPNRNSVLPQVANVGLAAQKPEQLVNDRPEVELLRGQERKSRTSGAKFKTRLRANNLKSAGAGAISSRSSFFEQKSKEILICLHAFLA